MTELIEFADEVPIVIEVASDQAGLGVNAVGSALGSVTAKVAATFGESLKIIGAVGGAVRTALEGSGVEEAEVKIGLKACGTGQFIIAQSTVEGAVEVTFKVKVSR
ncbi:hypothetical protein ACUTJJ_03185 [Agrobacterium sp. DKPNP3]|uniref:hypothetical protein n=1 Tax=Agrobacterium sp. DKPNP3 TaxID=3457323 RepID=UPI004043B61C